MKLGLAVFGAAALIGVGFVIGKKLIEKKRMDEEFFDELDDFEEIDEEDIDVDVFVKERYSDKIRKASLFAVGAIKTGADKLGETIQDIKSKDMVKKGEQTFDAVKETGGNIKNDIKRDIEDLKNMVSSINDEEQTTDTAFSSDDVFETKTDDIAEE